MQVHYVTPQQWSDFAEKYQSAYMELLHMSLVSEKFFLTNELAALTRDNVLPLRRRWIEERLQQLADIG